jgi:hypothetical protein
VFIPTAKNAPARDFYATRGFQAVESGPAGDGAIVFEHALDSSRGRLKYPQWVRMVEG